MPKLKDAIWKHFKCIQKKGNSGKWAICKKCDKEMQGIPERMKVHFNEYSNDGDVEKSDDQVQGK